MSGIAAGGGGGESSASNQIAANQLPPIRASSSEARR